MPEHQVFVGPANAILSSIAPRGKVVSPRAAPDELVPAELHLKLIAATKRKHRLLHSADPSILTIENAVPDKLCEAVSADMSAQLGTTEAPMVCFDQTTREHAENQLATRMDRMQVRTQLLQAESVGIDTPRLVGSSFDSFDQPIKTISQRRQSIRHEMGLEIPKRWCVNSSSEQMQQSFANSQSMTFGRGISAAVDKAESIVSQLIGIPLDMFEPSEVSTVGADARRDIIPASRYCLFLLLSDSPPQVLRYAGQETGNASSGAHFNCKGFAGGSGNEGLITGLLYLNTIDSGGETVFPALGVSIKPRQAKLLLFENVDNRGRCHPLAMHLAHPVKGTATKLVLKMLIHAKAFNGRATDGFARERGHITCGDVDCRWYERAFDLSPPPPASDATLPSPPKPISMWRREGVGVGAGSGVQMSQRVELDDGIGVGAGAGSGVKMPHRVELDDGVGVGAGSGVQMSHRVELDDGDLPPPPPASDAPLPSPPKPISMWRRAGVVDTPSTITPVKPRREGFEL